MGYKFPLCLDEIKDILYDYRDGKITLQEAENILQKDIEYEGKSTILKE